MSKEFKRQGSTRHSKIGLKRKKLQKWRRPKGRDSKMRLSRKGYSKSVSLGYKSPRKDSGKIENLTPILVHNVRELNSLDKNSIAILARVGAKKKLEIINEANQKKIRIFNLGGQKQ
jgi:large subunit ribosomal protein L32e